MWKLKEKHFSTDDRAFQTTAFFNDPTLELDNFTRHGNTN